MPIIIPEQLPAAKVLSQENIPVMSAGRASSQDIRPLKLLLLNLMPEKVQTETQILRALGSTPLQLDVSLIHMQSYESKNVSQEHLQSFYKTWDQVKDECFDGFIVTGAPIAHMPYEEVAYWEELKTIFEWADHHVFSCFYICWAAKARLYYDFKIEKTLYDKKFFGLFTQTLKNKIHPLVLGFDDYFKFPVSCYTLVEDEAIKAQKTLEVLADSEGTGPAILYDETHRRTYSFHHPEYDLGNLQKEYERDQRAGKDTDIPVNYYPDDDPNQQPHMLWRAHRHLLFLNWVNMVYQGTPYNLNDIKELS